MVNVVSAGRGVPVKFSLGGNYGLAILAPGYPQSQPVSCTSSDPVNAIEETLTAGSSSLQFDASSNTYTYVWKTEKSWANTCRTLIVRLTNGTDHTATFKFVK